MASKLKSKPAKELKEAKAASSSVAPRKYRMYINGQFVEGHLRAFFPVYDPSTEQVIAEVPDAEDRKSVV